MKPERRRALLARSGAMPFSGDDIRYLERCIYDLLTATDEAKCERLSLAERVCPTT
jgi:hypothetical protein